MTNADLAAEFRAQADQLKQQRAVLLTASVALATTRTTASALKALRELRPGEVRDQAIGLIEQANESLRRIA